MAESGYLISVQVDGKMKEMDSEKVGKLCFQNVDGACHASLSKGRLACIPGGAYCAATINTSSPKFQSQSELSGEKAV
jgi:hypothetical protein